MWWAAMALLVVACGDSDKNNGSDGCGIVGQVFSCPCPGGRLGVQACGADGTLGECVCEEDEAPTERCSPGTMEACLCPDLSTSVRVCDSNGEFAACVCPAPAGGSGGTDAAGGATGGEAPTGGASVGLGGSAGAIQRYGGATGAGAPGAAGAAAGAAGAAGYGALAGSAGWIAASGASGAAGAPQAAGAAGFSAGFAGQAGAAGWAGSAGAAAWAGAGGCLAPDVPDNPSPPNAATGVNRITTTTFDWDDAAGAETYDVYLGTTCPPPSYPSPLYQTVTDSALVDLNLTERTDYCWRVVAVGADPGCYTEGPLWTLETACDDPGPGAPAVTSSGTNYPSGTTGGSYALIFSEPVTGVATNLIWTPVVGSGTLDRVTTIDARNYALDFSGVTDGDVYTVSVTGGVTAHFDRPGQQGA